MAAVVSELAEALPKMSSCHGAVGFVKGNSCVFRCSFFGLVHCSIGQALLARPRAPARGRQTTLHRRLELWTARTASRRTLWPRCSRKPAASSLQRGDHCSERCNYASTFWHDNRKRSKQRVGQHRVESRLISTGSWRYFVGLWRGQTVQARSAWRVLCSAAPH